MSFIKNLVTAIILCFGWASIHQHIDIQAGDIKPRSVHLGGLCLWLDDALERLEAVYHCAPFLESMKDQLHEQEETTCVIELSEEEEYSASQETLDQIDKQMGELRNILVRVEIAFEEQVPHLSCP